MKMCFPALAALTLALPVALVTPAHAAAALPALPYDVDGDGCPELVVGAPDLQVGLLKGAGGVVVVPGSREGLALREQVITQNSPGVPGPAEKGDGFGAAVTSADFDRDGYADLAVGSPLDNVGTEGTGTRGGVLTGTWSSVARGSAGARRAVDRGRRVLPGPGGRRAVDRGRRARRPSARSTRRLRA